MRELDLSVYFDPCPFLETDSFYRDRTLRLGRVVEKYTVREHFPSAEGADVVLIGLSESRGVQESREYVCNGADNIRKDLYNLYPPQGMGKVVDLGNFRCGKNLEDTYYALDEVISYFLPKDMVVLLLGGSQDLTYGVYRAYARLRRMANFLSVDARLNIAENMTADENPQTAPLTHNTFMSRIAVEPDNYLFNYINIGYQTYLVDPEARSLMSKLNFDSCRLGAIRDDIQETEPYVRGADCLSFDLCAVKRSESPANPWARPTGLNAEQACQIFRYAGMSRNLQVAGVFEYYPMLDREGQSAELASQMIWCFLDAMQYRMDDHPLTGENVEFKEYIVPLENTGRELVFYKCKQTDRWWMALPCTEDQKKQYGRHCFLPCGYSDYQTALRNEIPARWWGALGRIRI